jgi:hypothetical protein
MRMRAGLLLLALAGCAHAQDPREIVKHSLSVDSRNDLLLRNYTYRVPIRVNALDSRGTVRDTHTFLHEVLYLGGAEYRHALEKDGKPLPAAEAKKEREKLDRAVAEAARLSDAEKQKRSEERDRKRAKSREQFQAIPDAFDFQLVGEASLNGRDAWQIHATPKPGYKGPHADLMRNMEGTLWIDKKDYEWAKVEADSWGTISLGLFIARIGKGTRISFENARLNDELWAPARASVKVSGRLGLLLKFQLDQEIVWSDYKKFQTDSRMVAADEAEK